MIKIANIELDDAYFKKLVKRCEAKVAYPDGHDDNACWIWKALKTDGYGMISIKNRSVRAMYVFWARECGVEVGHNIYLQHSCENKDCVNPNHLFLREGKRFKPRIPAYIVDDLPKKDGDTVEALLTVLSHAFNMDSSDESRYRTLRFNILKRTILDLYKDAHRLEALRVLRNRMWFLEDIGISSEWVRKKIEQAGLKL